MRAPPPPSASWAYFLDCDGTLVELAPTPDAVRLTARAHAVIRALFARCRGAVALVSGRSIADLDRIMGAPPLPAAGQHGLEWRDAGEHASAVVDAQPALQEARARLTALAAEQPALVLEDKGLSLAVHYRRAPELSAVAHAAVERELERIGDAYRLQRGKYVVELRPAAGGKAHAIAAFMARDPFDGRVPVFIGDDETDEEGFALVNAAGGLSIHVGDGPTVARWALPDPGAVVEWLEQAV
ncbi:MAG: trehalose-6-phosphatase [Gemmatimonadetes bacterium]|nr:trehalose-6-phosphatase [Gemmatimonadota bacterium]